MKVSEKRAETSCCTDTSCTSSKQTVKVLEKTTPCCETDKESSSDPIPNPEGQKPARQTIESFTYQVQGMDCPSCAATIEKSLHTVNGIETVKVNYSAGKMTVGVSDSAVADQIPIQVKKLGFETNAVETKKNGQVYRVDGMDCGACAVTIEKHLLKNSAVQNVKVNFSTGKMQILHTAQDKEIIQEVERAGFQASLVTKERKTEEKKKTE